MYLACEGLQVVYGAGASAVEALGGVTFDCRIGEFVSIIGPSGCGKSALLRAIAGLLPARDGRVHFGGAEPRLSLVFQEGALFPWLTTLDNAAFSLEAQGVGKAERHRRAREWLARFGLSGSEKAYPHELSAGMRQRAALVRGILSEPDFLLMDEPFAALDAQTRLMLQRELLSVWRQRGWGILFVTHDIEEAITLSERILVFSRRPGRLVSQHILKERCPSGAIPGGSTVVEDLKKRLLEELGLWGESEPSPAGIGRPR